MPWIVHATAPNPFKTTGFAWDFRDDYFPRKMHYKKDAEELAMEAIVRGATGVRVEKIAK